MPNAECNCLLGLLVVLAVAFVGLALLHFPTRRKQKELEYLLRQAEGEWKGEKPRDHAKSWDQTTPQ